MKHQFILTVVISCHWHEPRLQKHGNVLTREAHALKEVTAFSSTGWPEVIQHGFDEFWPSCCRGAWGVKLILAPSFTGHHLTQLHYDWVRLTAEDVEQFNGVLSQDWVHIFMVRVDLLIHGQTPSADTNKEGETQIKSQSYLWNAALTEGSK